MKRLLFFALVLFGLSVNAATIADYTIPVSVPLNDNLTVYGKYSDPDVLCSFYVFDAENLDVNRVIVRLSDQYTFSDGSFYFEYKITEPLFKRGFDYNAITKCGTIETSALFYVEQKEDIVLGITADSLAADMSFWTDSNNSLTVVIMFVAILFVVGFGAYFIRVSRVFQ